VTMHVVPVINVSVGDTVTDVIHLCINLYYPHMPIGKVWIYHLLFVCFCWFVCLFVRRFMVVQGRESPILGNFAPPEAQNRTNRPAHEGQ